MRLLCLMAGILVLANSSAAPAQEDARTWDEIQEVFDRGCGDDNGIDRCNSEVQQRMRALYAIDSPADLLNQGITVRRALFVDGYGNDVAAVTFARRPGESPMVEVKAPAAEGGPEPRPLVAAVANETWATVLARSRNFDQLLARELPGETSGGDSSDRSICLHGWFVVVEAVDAPRVSPNVLAGTGSDGMARDPALPVEAPMNPGKIRSDAESACADGLAVDYAFELARIALAALPECSTLSLDDFRNQAVLLAQCHRLGGDRLVAGEANAIVRKLDRALRLDQNRELEWLFVGSGDRRAKLFLAALDGGSPHLFAPVGRSADHATIEGQVVYFDEGAGGVGEVADITLRLLRQVGDFVIDTFEVSNRRPFTPDR